MKKEKVIIVAPLSTRDEARTMPGLGAEELYFSVQPQDKKTAISRRELLHANFRNIEDVELAAQIASRRNWRMITFSTATTCIRQNAAPAQKNTHVPVFM